MTSSWFFLSTLNYDARSTTHQISRNPVPRFILYLSFFFFFEGWEGGVLANYIAKIAALKPGIRPATQIFFMARNLIVGTIFMKNTYWFLSKSN